MCTLEFTPAAETLPISVTERLLLLIMHLVKRFGCPKKIYVKSNNDMYNYNIYNFIHVQLRSVTLLMQHIFQISVKYFELPLFTLRGNVLLKISPSLFQTRSR